MNLVLLGILLYVVVQLGVGVWVSRWVRDEDDYLLAGRSLGFGLLAFSVFATWFGAETCISSAGAVYEKGLSGASAEPFGYGLCILFMAIVFAVPLWRRHLTTLADLFRERYSSRVESLAVLLMVPTSILWAAAQIRAFGQVLDASSGIGVVTGITVAAAVAVIYTSFGGLRADVVTDLVQGVAIIVGLGAILWAVLGDDGKVMQTLQAMPADRWGLVSTPAPPALAVLEEWMVPICGSVVAQELVSRILAARSPVVARRAAMAGGFMYLAVGIVPVFLGLVGAALVPGLEDPEQVIPRLAQEHLGTLLYILFAGALVSAILSTVDSTLLAASSLVAHNLIVTHRPGLSEATKVRIARWGVIVGGAVAYVLALQGGRIYDLIENASSFGSAGVFVIMVCGLFTRWGGAASAGGALIAGTVVWTAGRFMMGWPYPFLTSLAAAAAAYAALSWVRPRSTTASHTAGS